MGSGNPKNGSLAITTEAYILAPNTSKEVKIDLDWAYDGLTERNYRLIKHFNKTTAGDDTNNVISSEIHYYYFEIK